MLYITNTFSPMMVSETCTFTGKEISLTEIQEVLLSCPLENMESAIGHDVTASVINALVGHGADFKANRINLSLKSGDYVFCIIPSFRADVAREFTQEEVASAGYRCFGVQII